MLTNFSTILVSSGSCLLSSPYVTRTYKHLVFTKRIIKLVTRIVSKTTFLVITTVPKWIIRHIGSVLNHIITYSYFVVTYEEDDIASNITTALALGMNLLIVTCVPYPIACQGIGLPVFQDFGGNQGSLPCRYPLGIRKPRSKKSGAAASF